MEEFIKNDEFIQYIINQYFPANNMSYHEKIQNVFSSTEDFTKAKESFKLSHAGIQPALILTGKAVNSSLSKPEIDY